MTGALRVVSDGLASTVQDLGRPGWAHVGVPMSGAVDPWSMAAVNRAVGNAAHATVIETAGGLRVVSVGPSIVACTRSVAPTVLRDGDHYELVGGASRQWHYLAVRGGFEVSKTLGSAATDTLTALGPPPLRAGDTILIRPSEPGPVADLQLPVRLGDRIRVTPGPRVDWFVDAAWERLLAGGWTVAVSSRIGTRLSGPPLRRGRPDELPSEGLVRGAIQVPHDGAPVVMGADHPTTGGYPVIAVVHHEDLTALLQRSAGDHLRFVS